jgi:hypothetical protein
MVKLKDQAVDPRTSWRRVTVNGWCPDSATAVTRAPRSRLVAWAEKPAKDRQKDTDAR